ncbi:cyclin-domain-containing protein [Dipodascopsis uninucleata]
MPLNVRSILHPSSSKFTSQDKHDKKSKDTKQGSETPSSDMVQQFANSNLGYISPRPVKRSGLDNPEESPRLKIPATEKSDLVAPPSPARLRQSYRRHPHSPSIGRRRLQDASKHRSVLMGESSNNVNAKSTAQEDLGTNVVSSDDRHNSELAAPPPSVSSQEALVSIKVLPRSYFDCDMKDLIILISSMLGELINLNDSLPLVSSQLTRFHSRAPPMISHKDYLQRIVRFCSMEKSALLATVFYIDLLCAAYSSFTINSLTVHRFLITSAAVSSKGLCDSFCTNSHYARVGGISLAELNLLEVEFLVRVGWRVVPPYKALDEYYRRMVARMSTAYCLEDKPTDINDSNSANLQTEDSSRGDSKQEIEPNNNMDVSGNEKNNDS